MKTFSFYIPSENYSYSFSLNTGTRNGIMYVDSIALRPPYPDYLISLCQIGETWLELNEFQNDLNTFVSYMIQIGGKVTKDMLIQTHLKLCWKHINQHARLLPHDLFAYADLATLVFHAIYQAEMNVYYNFHQQCIMEAKAHYSDFIKPYKNSRFL